MRLVPSISLSLLIAATAIAFTLTSVTSRTTAHRATGTPIPFPTSRPLAGATPFAGEPIKIVTTLGLVADWARQVGGDRVDVTAMLPPNADPHEYDPKPADVSMLDGADLVLTFGLELDRWAEGIIAASGSNAPVVTVSSGLQSLRASEDSSEFDVDPHVWFDPTLTAEIIDEIAAALISMDPAGDTVYKQRASAYQQALDQLDRAIQHRIDTIPADQRKLVTNHDALGYYANRYGLTVVGTVIPSLDSQAEASAADIANLMDIIEDENVTVIFSENTVPPDLAETVAAQSGVRFVGGLYTDSLDNTGSGVDTYLEMMETDTEIIVSALTAP